MEATNENKSNVQEIKEYFQKYSIQSEKGLNHKDIYAFTTQVSKNNLLTILKDFNINIDNKEKFNKNFVLEKIVYPIKEQNQEKEFKEKLITSIENKVKNGVVETPIHFDDFYYQYTQEFDKNKPLYHNDVYAFINHPKNTPDNINETISKFVKLEEGAIQNLKKSTILKKIVYPIKEQNQEKEFKAEIEDFFQKNQLSKEEYKSSYKEVKYSKEEFQEYYNKIINTFDYEKPINHNLMYAFINSEEISTERKLEVFEILSEELKTDVLTEKELFKIPKNKLLEEFVYPLRAEENQNLSSYLKENIQESLNQSKSKKI